MLDAYFRRRAIPLWQFASGACIPVHFGSAREEHLATRRAAGLFDFSFMGCFAVSGPDSLRYLHRVQTRNLHLLDIGTIAYTLLLRENGTVWTDATVWRHGRNDYWVFTGRREDYARLTQHARDFDVQIADVSAHRAVLSLQGPCSAAVLGAIVPDFDLSALQYFRFAHTRILDEECWIARIGYSGELGYEILVGATAADAVWKELVQAGAAYRLRECGFDAADSLRIEAGYILYSAELTEAVMPGELGLERLVCLYHADFIGRDALRPARWKTPPRALVGLQFPDAAPSCTDASDHLARVTSRAWSPVFQCDIALAFVDYAARSPGNYVVTQTDINAVVTRLPFYDPARQRPRLKPVTQ